MNRRQVNLQDAGLPAAPTPKEFAEQLKEWKKLEVAKNQTTTVDPIHGTTFSRNQPQKKKGTKGTEFARVTCALEFAAVLEDTNVKYANLDEWMVSWGRWTIAPVQ